MGNMSFQKKSLIIGECSIPAYCIKSIGSRHFVVAGGGGAVKTGVKNELEIFLLTYNQLTSDPNKAGALQAKQTLAIDTSIYANMNMDSIALDNLQQGKFLIAVGQDKNCALYESTGFCLSQNDNNELRLSFNFIGVCRFQTDWHSHDSYQKCVKFFKCIEDQSVSFHLATGGADGNIRIWNASKLLKKHGIKLDDENFDFNEYNSEPKHLDKVKPELKINVAASGEVDDLDVSLSSEILASISGKDATLWDIKNGEKLMQLPEISQIATARIRAIRFLNLDKSGRNEILLCAYNQRVLSKENSYLAVWAYEKKCINCHLLSYHKACQESIACLAINESGDYVAIGTMSGSVGVFNTHNLNKPIYFSSHCHSNFVTSVEFLPQRSYDSYDWGSIDGDSIDSIFFYF